MAEFFFEDHFVKGHVGGADEPEVYGNFLGRAHPLYAPVLQHGEELGLQRGGKVTDLVEEDGAAGGDLKAPGFVLARIGKGALYVAEQLALRKGLANGPEVYTNKHLVAPGRLPVYGARYELFARAVFAQD